MTPDFLPVQENVQSSSEYRIGPRYQLVSDVLEASGGWTGLVYGTARSYLFWSRQPEPETPRPGNLLLTAPVLENASRTRLNVASKANCSGSVSPS